MLKGKYLLIGSLFLLGCATREAPNMQNQEHQKNQQQEKLVAYNRLLLAYQDKKIMEWADTNKVVLQKSPTGLFYKIIQKGKKASAKKGDKVTISYDISLLEGPTCYSSDSLGLRSFAIGYSHELPGIQEGVTHIGKSGKILLIIPPHLAFGVGGDQNKIPSRSIIKAEISLIDIQTKSKK